MIKNIQNIILLLCVLGAISINKNMLKARVSQNMTNVTATTPPNNMTINRTEPMPSNQTMMGNETKPQNITSELTSIDFYISAEDLENSNSMVLVDENGRTLYVFWSDKGMNTSKCNGDCALAWPPLLMLSNMTFKANPDSTVQEGLFSVIERDDKTSQLAYNGWPLYYFSLDFFAMDNLGDELVGAGNYWFNIRVDGKPDVPDSLLQNMNITSNMNLSELMISPFDMSNNYQNETNREKTIQVYHNEIYGDWLVDENNRTIYMFTPDMNGRNDNCQHLCAETWPPVVTSQKAKVVGDLDQTRFGSIERPDSLAQLTFNNLPLYYFKLDRYPGDILGQDQLDSGGLWFILNGKGAPRTRL